MPNKKSRITEIARKWVLQNAIKFNGQAQLGAIVGKLIQENPDVKNQLKDLMPELQKIVKDVNSTPVAKQLAELKKLAPDLLEEKPKEKGPLLKPLPNAEHCNVVMRMAPSPSGPLHIGHAFILALNAEYARLYNGKFILRFEDTNPENLYPPAYKMIEEDARWLTENYIEKVYIQSDRLGIYYDYAEKLIAKGKAYICTCDSDKFKELIAKQQACPCRNLPEKEHLKRWDMMFSSLKPGEAVMRIKTDINDRNPAMRDWPAMRINDEKHPRAGTEYRVWPLMNLAVAVDDHEMGITHTIRGKDHMDNAKRQAHIFDFFGWKKPTHLYFGRINFEGLEISKTKTKAKIDAGVYDGWDDIRLPFLAALKRRGYHPDSFVKYAVDIGLSQTDKTVSGDEFFKVLNSHNRELLDPVACRYFFIDDPVEVKIKNAPERFVELHLHPEDHMRGKRKFDVQDNFYLAKEDHSKLRLGKLYRLMDCINFKKTKSGCIFDSQEYEKYRESGEAIMHWLPVSRDLVDVEVLMPDKSLRKGFGESAMKNLKEGGVVQLERFGFCRLDKKEGNKLVFWFAHK